MLSYERLKEIKCLTCDDIQWEYSEFIKGFMPKPYFAIRTVPTIQEHQLSLQLFSKSEEMNSNILISFH